MKEQNSENVPMFYGEFRSEVDDKGRFIFPVKFRDYYGRGPFVLRSSTLHVPDSSFYEHGILYTPEHARKFLESCPRYKRTSLARDLVTVSLDDQYRILVPVDYREYLGIKQNGSVFLISTIDDSGIECVELWDSDRLADYEEDVAAVDRKLRGYREKVHTQEELDGLKPRSARKKKTVSCSVSPRLDYPSASRDWVNVRIDSEENVV